MTEISVNELNSLSNYTVIDIRDKIAFEYGSINGAVNIPQKDITNRLNLLDRSKLIVVMCKSGINSDTVAGELRELGYNAVNLKNGYYGYMLQNIDAGFNRQKEIERSINKKFQKTIWNRFTAALNEYDLLQEGDRVAVCISGGKDSMLMAKLFQELKRHNKYPFEVVYLVMDPGYSPENREIIERNAKMLGIPVTVFETDIFESVLHVEKYPCYICARMRRGHLYSKAKELGCNKIALGHHFDDVVETTLMAMLYGGQIQAMPPKLRSTNFEGMELIRPMYLIHEKDIKHWRDYNGLHFLQCACKFTDTCTSCNPDNASKRQETKRLIESLEKTNPRIKNNIFSSIHNVNLDTLVAYKTNGIKHSFSEKYGGKIMAHKIITASDFAKLDSGKITVVDLREPDEVLVKGFEGAINIPFSEFYTKLDDIPREKPVYVICRTGDFSKQIAEILDDRGYEVYNVEGGFNAYIEAVRNSGPVFIDAKGLKCPGPIVKVADTVKTLSYGQKVYIEATEDAFASDIKVWCERTGNNLLEIDVKPSLIKAVVEKAKKAESAAGEIPHGKNFVVFSGDLDKTIAAFIMANGAAAMGREVTIFFTFWGLNILRKAKKVQVKKTLIEKMFGFMMPRGTTKLGLSRMNMGGAGAKMIRWIMKKKNIRSLEQLIEDAKAHGVRLIACQMSMDIMGIHKEELIDGIELGGVSTFLGAGEQSDMSLFI